MGTTKTTFGTRTNLSAPMTDLRSVVRLDSFNTLSFSDSFVFNKSLQLKEAPITNPVINLFASVLLPDSFQVFHHNLVSIEFGNNIFTDVVVDPSHPTSFSSRELSKKLFTGMCAFGLEFTTQVSELAFDLLDFSRVIKPVVRTDSEVVYSEVNAQNKVLRTVVLLNGSNLFRECEQEKTSAFFIHPKQTFFDFPPEIFSVTGRDIELELLSALEQSQNKNVAFEISTPWKIIHDTCSLYDGFRLSFLDHTTSLFDTSNCQLRWNFKLFPDFMVNGMMQFEVLSDFILPGIINTELQRFSVSFDSGNYLFGWIDSDFSSCNSSHLKGKCMELNKISPLTTEIMGFQNKGFL